VDELSTASSCAQRPRQTSRKIGINEWTFYRCRGQANLDHQNRRQAYVEAFFDHLANWRFAEANLTIKRAAA
jgi:hypothetical protein